MNAKARSRRKRRRITREQMAWRFAVYLDSKNIQPILERLNLKDVLKGLTHQYLLVADKQRDVACKPWKSRIQQKGLRRAVAAVLPDLVLMPPPMRSPRPPVIRRQRCPRCRTRKVKTIWESEEAAETFGAGSGDAGLHAYQCPHGYGWHAGHSHNPVGSGDWESGRVIK